MLRKSHPKRRRGISSLLAMMYLVLFSALAVGFFSASGTAVEVSYNDEHAVAALCAADSGMDFMRYQLAAVNIDPSTPPTSVINALYSNLQNQINGTANLAGVSIAMNGNTIDIPGQKNQFINLDATALTAFHATITDWAGEIVVKITGRYATPAMLASGSPTLRTITMDFTRQDHPTTTFNYAVASKGMVTVTKGGVVATDPSNNAIAKLMSAAPVSAAVNISGGTVGGDLNIVSGGSALVTGGSVGGETSISQIYANHVFTVDTPQFPFVDTSVYKQYATNAYVPNAKVQQNIIVPPGTNPHFNANDTVQGIMYIQSPNNVVFNGNFNLQGFIVFENTGDSTSNTMTFKGNLTQSLVPSGTQFDALRATAGVSMLAPTTAITMSGSTSSTLIGSVIMWNFAFNGSAGITIDRGTLMTLNPNNNSANFSGQKVQFTATGAGNMPTQGLSYMQYYAPKQSSYQEVLP